MRSVIAHFEEALGALLVVAIGLIATAQVVGRYLLDNPLAWTQELASTLFAYLVFVGATIALKHHDHFAVDALVQKLPEKIRKWVEVFGILCVLAFCGLIVYYGALLVGQSRDVTSEVLGMSKAWVYAAVPFGGALMGARGIQILVQVLRGQEDTTEHASPEEAVE